MTRGRLPSRMLGIDAGSRRIGVAVSEGRVAVPLTIIEHRDEASDVARVVAAAQDERVEAIVVGLPLAPDGGEGAQARTARRFGEQIAAATDIPVIFHDERLTTSDVAAAAAASGRRGKRGAKPRLDDMAAALILQRYIDEHGGARE